MTIIPKRRLRRFLIFPALLFSLNLSANELAIFHISYSIFHMKCEIWNMKYVGAISQEMPNEKGDFRAPDLVELVKLDSTIKLDIRYATSNNFLGRLAYKEARAFLQRPAAEAIVRANRKLREKGYGLVIFDGYRPWSVTKIFWDSTPRDKKQFVADPSQGSRHNRGCAVDLTLYDLRSGRQIEMPSGYDEFTDRAYPNYPGGTEEQRRMRGILREAMESEGFTIYEFEWWHFDYKDWKRYPILNISFDQIN